MNELTALWYSILGRANDEGINEFTFKHNNRTYLSLFRNDRWTDPLKIKEYPTNEDAVRYFVFFYTINRKFDTTYGSIDLISTTFPSRDYVANYLASLKNDVKSEDILISGWYEMSREDFYDWKEEISEI